MRFSIVYCFISYCIQGIYSLPTSLDQNASNGSHSKHIIKPIAFQDSSNAVNMDAKLLAIEDSPQELVPVNKNKENEDIVDVETKENENKEEKMNATNKNNKNAVDQSDVLPTDSLTTKMDEIPIENESTIETRVIETTNANTKVPKDVRLRVEDKQHTTYSSTEFFGRLNPMFLIAIVSMGCIGILFYIQFRGKTNKGMRHMKIPMEEIIDDEDEGQWDDWETNQIDTKSSDEETLLPPVIKNDTRPLSPLSTENAWRDRHDNLKEILVNDHNNEYQLQNIIPQEISNDGSNSSSDSFEKINNTNPGLQDHTVPSTATAGNIPQQTQGKNTVKMLKNEAATQHQNTVDDLFSQFGMVPTFSKRPQDLLPLDSGLFTDNSTSPSIIRVADSIPKTMTERVPATFLLAEMEDDSLSQSLAEEGWGVDDEDWTENL